MGRPVFYRQRTRNQASSVQAKSLLTYLASDIRARREISPEEAWLVALDAQRFLEKGLLGRGPGQVELPCITGLESHCRQARWDQPEKPVRLTVVAEEDASLLEEFGTRVMQQGRLARMVEEAYEAHALLDGQRLCLLMPLTLSTLRSRLQPLWQQGAMLPLAGMTRKNRQALQAHRGTLAVQRYLQGADLTQLRRELAISHVQWVHWWRGFQEIFSSTSGCLSKRVQETGFSNELVASWLTLAQTYRHSPQSNERLGQPVMMPAKAPLTNEEERLRQRLTGEHGYNLASASRFMQELRDLAVRLKGFGPSPGQIVTFGVAADYPPGKSLQEARLLLVVLDYITTGDWEQVNRTSPQALKWARLQRLCTQSYEQGVALSQPDLAHLLGLSTDAVQNTIKKNDQVILPTRGRVADMGSTLSHAEKIITLYMDGYTETEIVRRSHHSYSSIEAYLWHFARVVCLAERGMPLPVMRQALGMSRKVLTRYLELYQHFSHPDFSFPMARIRRMVQGEDPTKKKRGD